MWHSLTASGLEENRRLLAILSTLRVYGSPLQYLKKKVSMICDQKTRFCGHED